MTAKGLGGLARQLVCERFAATPAPPGERGHDLAASGLGRVKVHARGRASRHLNWFHVRDVHLREFDYLVLVEFEPDGRTVAGAWGIPWEDVDSHAHSTIAGTHGRVTKLAVRGAWKGRVEQIELGGAGAGR